MHTSIQTKNAPFWLQISKYKNVALSVAAKGSVRRKRKVSLFSKPSLLVAYPPIWQGECKQIHRRKTRPDVSVQKKMVFSQNFWHHRLIKARARRQAPRSKQRSIIAKRAKNHNSTLSMFMGRTCIHCRGRGQQGKLGRWWWIASWPCACVSLWHCALTGTRVGLLEAFHVDAAAVLIACNALVGLVMFLVLFRKEMPSLQSPKAPEAHSDWNLTSRGMA